MAEDIRIEFKFDLDPSKLSDLKSDIDGILSSSGKISEDFKNLSKFVTAINRKSLSKLTEQLTEVTKLLGKMNTENERSEKIAERNKGQKTVETEINSILKQRNELLNSILKNQTGFSKILKSQKKDLQDINRISNSTRIRPGGTSGGGGGATSDFTIFRQTVAPILRDSKRLEKSTSTIDRLYGSILKNTAAARGNLAVMANNSIKLRDATFEFTKKLVFVSVVLRAIRTISLAIFNTVRAASAPLLTTLQSIIDTGSQAQQQFNVITSIFRTSGGEVRTGKFVEQIRELQKRIPITLKSGIELIRQLATIPDIREEIDKSADALEGVVTTVQRLAILDPVQGIEGAVFALREGLSGDLRSLKRRFEIPVDFVASTVGATTAELTKDSKLFLKAIGAFLENILPTEEFEKQRNNFAFQVELFKDNVNTFLLGVGNLGAVGPLQENSVVTFFSKQLRSLNDEIKNFIDSPDFKNFGSRITETLNSSFDVLRGGGSNVLQGIGGIFGITPQSVSIAGDFSDELKVAVGLFEFGVNKSIELFDFVKDIAGAMRDFTTSESFRDFKDGFGLAFQSAKDLGIVLKEISGLTFNKVSELVVGLGTLIDKIPGVGDALRLVFSELGKRAGTVIPPESLARPKLFDFGSVNELKKFLKERKDVNDGLIKENEVTRKQLELISQNVQRLQTSTGVTFDDVEFIKSLKVISDSREKTIDSRMQFELLGKAINDRARDFQKFAEAVGQGTLPRLEKLREELEKARGLSQGPNSPVGGLLEAFREIDKVSKNSINSISQFNKQFKDQPTARGRTIVTEENQATVLRRFDTLLQNISKSGASKEIENSINLIKTLRSEVSKVGKGEQFVFSEIGVGQIETIIGNNIRKFEEFSKRQPQVVGELLKKINEETLKQFESSLKVTQTKIDNLKSVDTQDTSRTVRELTRSSALNQQIADIESDIVTLKNRNFEVSKEIVKQRLLDLQAALETSKVLRDKEVEDQIFKQLKLRKEEIDSNTQIEQSLVRQSGFSSTLTKNIIAIEAQKKKIALEEETINSLTKEGFKLNDKRLKQLKIEKNTLDDLTLSSKERIQDEIELTRKERIRNLSQANQFTVNKGILEEIRDINLRITRENDEIANIQKLVNEGKVDEVLLTERLANLDSLRVLRISKFKELAKESLQELRSVQGILGTFAAGTGIAGLGFGAVSSSQNKDLKKGIDDITESMKKFKDVVTGIVKPAFDEFIKSAKENFDKFGISIKSLGNSIGDFFKGLRDKLVGTLFDGLGNALSDSLTSFLSGGGGSFRASDIFGASNPLFKGLGKATSSFLGIGGLGSGATSVLGFGVGALASAGLSNLFGPTKQNRNEDTITFANQVNKSIDNLNNRLFEFALENVNIATDVLGTEFEKSRIVSNKSGGGLFSRKTVTTFGEGMRESLESIQEFFKSIFDNQVKLLDDEKRRQTGLLPEKTFNDLLAEDKTRIDLLNKEIERRRTINSDAVKVNEEFGSIENFEKELLELITKRNQIEIDIFKQQQERFDKAITAQQNLRGESPDFLDKALRSGNIDRFIADQKIKEIEQRIGNLGIELTDDQKAARAKARFEETQRELESARTFRDKSLGTVSESLATQKLIDALLASEEAKKEELEITKELSSSIKELTEIEKQKLQNTFAGLTADQLSSLTPREFEEFARAGTLSNPLLSAFRPGRSFSGRVSNIGIDEIQRVITFNQLENGIGSDDRKLVGLGGLR